MIIPGLILIIFVLILIICILSANKIIHQANEEHDFYHNKFIIDYINGTRIIKKQSSNDSFLSRHIKYPTIDVTLDYQIPCGVYNAQSNYGALTIFISFNGIAHCHFHSFVKEIDSEDRFIFYKLKKLAPNNNGLIMTYNMGCKTTN